MSHLKKTIELYFKNEDEAESARASLNTLRISNLVIEEMLKDTDQTLFVPFTAANVSSGNFQGGSVFSPFSGAFVAGITNEEGEDQVTHLLRVDVDEQEYEKFLEIVRNYDCYVRK